MNNEWQRIWRKVAMAYFKILLQHLPIGIEENRDFNYESRSLD
jgi:hypothetical protein